MVPPSCFCDRALSMVALAGTAALLFALWPQTMPVAADLGVVGARVASACSVQRSEHRTVLARYAIRIEEQVAVSGCGAVHLFARV
jgi:anti-sigma-K factor RskA